MLGPEYLTVIVTSIVSAVTGGAWVANKTLERTRDKITHLSDIMHLQDERIKDLEKTSTLLPIEYVLKADYLRELQSMNTQFEQINNKLDQLIQNILFKKNCD